MMQGLVITAGDAICAAMILVVIVLLSKVK